MVRLYAIGVFVSTATPLDLQTAIWVAGVIVVLYTVVGGLWAVVMTDMVQFIVLITAAMMLVPLSLYAVGGWEALSADKPDHFNLLSGPKGEWSFLVVYYLMFAIKNNGNWTFIQRFYSVRDEKAGQKMGLLTALLFLVFPVFFLIPAIASASLLPDLENKEMAYVAIALELLPEGVMGIMLAAMFAATMSSLDSEYNVMASVITTDIYQRLFRPEAREKELMSVARITTLLVGLLVILGALFVDKFGGAFEASKLFTGLFAIPLVIPVIFGVLTRKANASGAILSLIFGVATGLILNSIPEISWQSATFLTIMVCVTIFLASAWWTKREKSQREKVDRFFSRLGTPVAESDKPEIALDFKRGLMILFIAALGAVGLLFTIISYPSISEYSGKLAMVGGAVCLAIAVALVFVLPGKKTG